MGLKTCIGVHLIMAPHKRTNLVLLILVVITSLRILTNLRGSNTVKFPDFSPTLKKTCFFSSLFPNLGNSTFTQKKEMLQTERINLILKIHHILHLNLN